MSQALNGHFRNWGTQRTGILTQVSLRNSSVVCVVLPPIVVARCCCCCCDVLLQIPRLKMSR